MQVSIGVVDATCAGITGTAETVEESDTSIAAEAQDKGIAAEAQDTGIAAEAQDRSLIYIYIYIYIYICISRREFAKPLNLGG